MMESTRRHHLLIVLGFILMLAFESIQIFEFFGYGPKVLSWPYELDYGEGIVWQQASMMFTPGAYGRIDGFPAIVFHYTPLYHVVTRGVAALLGMDMLYAGRLVSIVSTVLAMGMVAAISVRVGPAQTSVRIRTLAATGGALTIFSMWPVTYWAQLMRVDMLAFFLTLLGFWLGLKALDRPRLIYAAAIALVAAIYTKQTSIIAPAALFLPLFWLRRDLAIRLVVACLVCGGVTLAVLNWATSGGFVRHIFLYNINRLDVSQLMLAAEVIRTHIILIGVAIASIFLRIRSLRQSHTGTWRTVFASNSLNTAYLCAVAYLALATLMLGTIMKLGSAINYTIEFLFVIAIFVGLALIDSVRLVLQPSVGAHWSRQTLVTALVIPFALTLHSVRVFEPPFEDVWKPERVAEVKQLEALVRDAQKPVIADEMVLIRRAGKEVVWEPAIFAELAAKNVWDQRAFVARIRAGEFAFFITVGRRGTMFFDGRYNSQVADALESAYPVQQDFGEYTLHSPARVPVPAKP
jgi:4-amino-4-deoxy-L-arabinose transferase-like glycosyltransferase